MYVEWVCGDVLRKSVLYGMGSSGVYDVWGKMCYITAVTLLKQHPHLVFKGISIMTGIVTEHVVYMKMT